VTYEQTIEELFRRLPMYQRVGKSAFKKDLTNIIALCEALDHPQEKFKCIHIAGTNGKGSCSHFLASILQNCGYKTGLYTSPHLRDFRERIRIDAQCISKRQVVDFVVKNEYLINKIQPSFFEITVAMAFDYFASEEVDIAIIETGLGGRLDSTNIINPILSIITNIGWDHMDMLGDTLALIATEKAGIIKSGIPVIIGEKQIETTSVFETTAEQMNAPLYFAQDLVHIPTINSYQDLNKRTTRAALKLLNKSGCRLDNSIADRMIDEFPKGSGLHGRWEQIADKPLVIADTGHNADGVKWSLRQIAQETFQELHIVWGCVAGKEHIKILDLLPRSAHYYWCQPSVPRAYSSEELQKDAAKLGLNGIDHSSVSKAYQNALSKAKSEDLIFVGGSTFVVADLFDHLDLATCFSS